MDKGKRMTFYSSAGLLLLGILLLLLAEFGPGVADAGDDTSGSSLAGFTRQWRDDAIWYDGQAECAVYEASRVIYNQTRQYEARVFTNKENLDTKLYVKSNSAQDPVVFKYHLREDIPTENYDYHYSTMVYLNADTLASLKLDMGSQEDCGATFKQYIHRDGQVEFEQRSYFPDEGPRQGRYDAPAGYVFANALPVLLRGYPFENVQQMTIQLLPDQTSTHLSPQQPKQALISYLGQETLTVPCGSVPAHHLKLTLDQQEHHYWMAADPAMLHIMVKYSGPGPLTFELKNVERRAYWQR